VTRPPFEVADIVRQHGDRFLDTHHAWVTGQHRRVLRAIAQCRTAALGGHRDRCEQCAQPALSYNSCLMVSTSFWGALSPSPAVSGDSIGSTRASLPITITGLLAYGETANAGHLDRRT